VRPPIRSARSEAPLERVQVTPEWRRGEILQLAKAADHPGVGEPFQRLCVSADEVLTHEQIVAEQNQIAPSRGEYSRVATGRDAPVHGQALRAKRVRNPYSRQHRGGPVARSVVDDQHLVAILGHLLLGQREQRLLKCFTTVVGADDHAGQRWLRDSRRPTGRGGSFRQGHQRRRSVRHHARRADAARRRSADGRPGCQASRLSARTVTSA